MTPLPKRKHSTRRQGKRKQGLVYNLPNLGVCANCGAIKESHVVCPKCGYYKGHQALKIKTKREKKNENPS